MGDNIGTEIFWGGTTVGVGTMLSINGSGDGFGFDNIRFNANNYAAICVVMYSIRLGSFTNFSIQNFTQIGLSLQIRAGGGVQYASGNMFQNFIIISAYQGANVLSGLLIEGDYSTATDWHRNTFVDGIIQLAKQPSGTSYAGYFAFTDHNTFTNVDFSVYAAGTGFGLLLNGLNNNGYPENNFFYGGSIFNVTTLEDADVIGNNLFFGFTTVDGETVPTHPKCGGVTDSGVMFGLFRSNLGLKSNGFRAYSTNATLTSADLGRAIYYQGSSGTLTLPLASTCVGEIITVFNIAGSGTCTITRAGSDTLFCLYEGGGISIDLQGGDSISLVSQGSIWYQLQATKISENIISVPSATYSIVSTDQSIVNTYAAGTQTITLPNPALYKFRKLSFKTNQNQAVVSASSNVVPIIGGAATTSILAATAGKWADLVSDGSNWLITKAN
jgi:hypothetical protein